ncbi:uncharacterized protein MYCGRDRAFT_97697 [Zymoseptoria tritici IPO323]|uniref:Uncharacterized protein n=1 Tax=Zymoseptoria tritici (strain CBS 115943 / IPO323) TaxID=336722 RepID=F9XR10_ZYMTI|nr:uncharacterized protein MYCGRDRAFT_97697 [Zymoseptoria tritici IPO323]EGP82325.1 hypothetical protein MYCGRDRAFT_97697 [Zymoseptoria tritici IPO323]
MAQQARIYQDQDQVVSRSAFASCRLLPSLTYTTAHRGALEHHANHNKTPGGLPFTTHHIPPHLYVSHQRCRADRMPSQATLHRTWMLERIPLVSTAHYPHFHITPTHEDPLAKDVISGEILNHHRVLRGRWIQKHKR